MSSEKNREPEFPPDPASSSPPQRPARPLAETPPAKPFILAVNTEFLKKALIHMADLPELLLPAGLAAPEAKSPHLAADEAINAALVETGRLLGVSRAYIMQDEDDGRYLRNTHEWVDGKIGPAMHSWPLHDYDKDVPSLKPLMEGREYHAAHTRDLPPDLMRVLTMQSVRSVLLAPLLQNGAWIGLAGFDSCEYERDWREEEVVILRHLARLVSLVLERRESLAARGQLARIRAVLIAEDAPRRAAAPAVPENPQTLQAAERRLLTETLDIYHGNRMRAAKHLGLTWAALDRRCKKLGIVIKKD